MIGQPYLGSRPSARQIICRPHVEGSVVKYLKRKYIPGMLVRTRTGGDWGRHEIKEDICMIVDVTPNMLVVRHKTRTGGGYLECFSWEDLMRRDGIMPV
jgi:hypothetical protein